MSENSVCLNTELRKLKPAELYTLGQILNISDSWKKLMAIIPKRENCELPKFNAEHFSMIEQAAQQQKRNAAEIFLIEWGTMGKKRPTLHTLLNILISAELFRAADYVAGSILKEELPKRPKCGPAAPVHISDDEIRKISEEGVESQNTHFNESLIFALPSQIDDNKVTNPNVINYVEDNSLERNMQSTKLVSIKENHNEKYFENVERKDQSDLMKFSSDSNVKNNCSESQKCDFREQELMSIELPVFLNEFGQTKIERPELNQEATTDELPTFLNDSTATSSDNSIHFVNDNASSYSNLNLNQNEVSSVELPQCIVELGVNCTTNPASVHFNEENRVQNALNSQELPVTVLEYNK